MIFYNKKEGYAEYFLYIIRHERNWFLSNQKKCLTTACSEIKNKVQSEKINLVKSKKFCFNYLSNTHTISNCKSKILCRAKGCQKRHPTVLHSPPANKMLSVPLQSSDSPALINNETPENNIQLQVSSKSIQNKTQVFSQAVPVTLISNSCFGDKRIIRQWIRHYFNSRSYSK